MAHVDVATPDPMAGSVGAVTQEGSGLWVMDEDEVGLFENRAQSLRVPSIDLFIGSKKRVWDSDGLALESVVERLRACEELVVAVDHLPAGVETEFLH